MTIDEIRTRGEDVISRLEQLAKFLKIDDNKKEIAEIEQIMA